MALAATLSPGEGAGRAESAAGGNAAGAEKAATSDGAAACRHEVVFGGMCVKCLQDVSADADADALVGAAASIAGNGAPQKARLRVPTVLRRCRPGLVTPSRDLTVSASALRELEDTERRRRHRERKLVLVLDIDHTLLHTGSPQQAAYAVRYGLEGGVGVSISGTNGQKPQQYHVQKRPYLDQFLHQARELCDLYLYTHGAGMYAEAVVKQMDPDGKFFGTPPRLFHRDNTPQGLKSLREIFPGDTSHVIVVDDRDEVWPTEVRSFQLLKVAPFIFFEGDPRTTVSLEGCVASWQPAEQSSCTDQSPTRGRQEDSPKPGQETGSETAAAEDVAAPAVEPPKKRLRPSSDTQMHKSRGDQQLQIVVDIVRKIHAAVFADNIPTEGGTLTRAPPPLVDIVPSLRKRTLEGCVICMTGMEHPGVPLSRHPLAWWCTQLGALVEEELAERTTHVLAARRDATFMAAVQKRASGSSIHMVHPGWVLRAAATWQRPAEADYEAPEEGPWPTFVDVWLGKEVTTGARVDT
eukprot:TRINITY_DN7337_c0_g1_i1.p1 TRINITY_DN7337_c0_g1~~TRINITY_DN7337_c0_g1_i1.p1  ORF type:complete len:544 (-),score=105.27 TRINITY_DN7337_c0_g1_i1:55-1626(-)